MLRHLLAIAMPFIVTVIMPGVILLQTGLMNIGWSLPSPLNVVPVIGGVGLIGLGLRLMYKTVKMFATIGQGTLAPWDAPRKFVVQGAYRYVRNPMISGVVSIVLGESIFFGSIALLVWGVFVFLVNVVYIPLSEEPGLERRFGEAYRVYKANVPRWIPRLKPWALESGTRMNTDKHG